MESLKLLKDNCLVIHNNLNFQQNIYNIKSYFEMFNSGSSDWVKFNKYLVLVFVLAKFPKFHTSFILARVEWREKLIRRLQQNVINDDDRELHYCWLLVELSPSPSFTYTETARRLKYVFIGKKLSLYNTKFSILLWLMWEFEKYFIKQKRSGRAIPATRNTESGGRNISSSHLIFLPRNSLQFGSEYCLVGGVVWAGPGPGRVTGLYWLVWP